MRERGITQTGALLISAWKQGGVVCVFLLLVLRESAQSSLAWLHDNLISRKHRGRRLREVRWKNEEVSGVWWEKKIQTIPVWRFPWRQWHHRRCCLGYEWKNIQRTCLPSSALVPRSVSRMYLHMQSQKCQSRLYIRLRLVCVGSVEPWLPTVAGQQQPWQPCCRSQRY